MTDLPAFPSGFLEPKDVTLKTQNGVDRIYLISKFNAQLGRELVAKYPVANMPKLGEYSVSEECMFKLMTCVAALAPDKRTWIPLVSPALYNNHVPDWETGGKIEGAMWEHNCSFFGNEKASIFFGDIALNLRRWITSMLTDLLAQSSQKKGPPFTS